MLMQATIAVRADIKSRPLANNKKVSTPAVKKYRKIKPSTELTIVGAMMVLPMRSGLTTAG